MKGSTSIMCFGSRKGDEAGESRSRELDKIIRQDEKRMSKEVKLLLLGASSLRIINLPCICISLTCDCYRRRRVRKVDRSEADAIDLFSGLQQERKARMEASGVQQCCPINEAHLRRDVGLRN
jgi:hypothetical protein